MRKALVVAVALLAIAGLSGCTRVGPGHVGIVVEMAGSNKGVLEKPVRTGWVFYNPVNESVDEFPTYMQTLKWTRDANEGKPIDESITFTNKTSMVINADFSLSYALKPEKVPFFYVQFMVTGDEDLRDKFNDGYLRNVTRNCLDEHAGKYDIEQIMGDNAKFLKEARQCVQDQVTMYGVEIDQFGLIGAPRPPQNVVDAINSKVQAQQIAFQKQMELQQVQADAAKKVADAEGEAKAQIARANGDAEANRIRSSSITDPLLRMRALENQHDAIWRWNGQMPGTMLDGSGSKGNFLFQIPSKE